jgi:hypothetical protein
MRELKKLMGALLVFSKEKKKLTIVLVVRIELKRIPIQSYSTTPRLSIMLV